MIDIRDHGGVFAGKKKQEASHGVFLEGVEFDGYNHTTDLMILEGEKKSISELLGIDDIFYSGGGMIITTSGDCYLRDGDSYEKVTLTGDVDLSDIITRNIRITDDGAFLHSRVVGGPRGSIYHIDKEKRTIKEYQNQEFDVEVNTTLLGSSSKYGHVLTAAKSTFILDSNSNRINRLNKKLDFAAFYDTGKIAAVSVGSKSEPAVFYNIENKGGFYEIVKEEAFDSGFLEVSKEVGGWTVKEPHYFRMISHPRIKMQSFLPKGALLEGKVPIIGRFVMPLKVGEDPTNATYRFLMMVVVDKSGKFHIINAFKNSGYFSGINISINSSSVGGMFSSNSPIGILRFNQKGSTSLSDGISFYYDKNEETLKILSVLSLYPNTTTYAGDGLLELTETIEDSTLDQGANDQKTAYVKIKASDVGFFDSDGLVSRMLKVTDVKKKGGKYYVDGIV